MSVLLGSGELAALAAAGLWACSSLFYGRTRLTAWQINFGKNVLASFVLCLHLAIVTTLAGRAMFSADSRTWMILAVSSVVGIVIGDTFYFRSLQILGPRRALIVSTTSPLFASAIGWFGLAESPSVISLFGILLTLFGIAVVIAERSGTDETPGHFPASLTRGIVMGLAGAVCNAGGATFSRLGTQGSQYFESTGCDPLEATVIRVCVAAIASILTALAARNLISTAQKSFHPTALKSYAPAVLCGPWLGIWMSQIAYKNSMLAIAITLTCTTPLFIMPLLRIFYGVRISVRAVIGTSIALVGVYLAVAGNSDRGPEPKSDSAGNQRQPENVLRTDDIHQAR